MYTYPREREFRMIFSLTSFASPVIEMDDTKYHIIGRTNTGSRHYSETLSLSKALDQFPLYCGVVDYFGGGTVELFASLGETTIIVKKTTV